MELTNTQRQYLRRLAHDLRPLVQIGKNGLTESVLATIDRELDSHELIKIKFMDFQDEKQELTQQIIESTNSILVSMIGNTAITYREQRDAEKRKIVLPA